MMKLKDSGTDIGEDFVKNTALEFYTSHEYLKQWTQFFTTKFDRFKRVDVQKALVVLIEKSYID